MPLIIVMPYQPLEKLLILSLKQRLPFMPLFMHRLMDASFDSASSSVSAEVYAPVQ